MERATHYTTKKDLYEHIPGEQYYTPGDPSTRGLSLKISSGTTGVPVISIIGPQTNRYNRMWRFIRMTPKNTSMLATLNSALNESPHPLSFFPVNMGEYELLAPEEIRAVFTAFMPREFRAIRSIFLKAIDDLERKQLLDTLDTIQVIDLTAETVEASHLKHIRRFFPRCEMLYDYGASEGGNIADSCPSETHTDSAPSERKYHPVGDRFVEIVDPDENGFGEIIMTSREFYRYRTGDLGKLVDEACSCGAAKTLYIGGRIDYDVARCAGASFFASDVEKIFARFHSQLADYMLDVSEYVQKGAVQGHVACSIVLKRDEASSAEKVKEHVCEALMKELYITPTRTLGDLIQEGIFLPIDVKLVDAIERRNVKKYHLRKI